LHGGGGNEAVNEDVVGVPALLVVEEAQHGGRPVEDAVLAEESAVQDKAAPALADQGGAHEARRVGRREAEEDLADEVVHEPRRQRRRHLAALLCSAGSLWQLAVAPTQGKRGRSRCGELVRL